MRRRLIRIARIAQLTGIPEGTIHSWRHRDQFPPPDQVVDGVSFWYWPDIGVELGVLDPPNPLLDHLEQLGG